MTRPFLTLDGVSYVLPTGRTLFSDLAEAFDARRTGLVGRNGAGKTILGQILAGRLEPSAGRCERQGRVHHSPQRTSFADTPDVAALAGVSAPLRALRRIEGGSIAPEDFDAVEGRWDLPSRLEAELEREGLAHLEPDTPTDRLSGGEAVRVTLIGAILADADIFILDEPSNHLDLPARRTLIERLNGWTRGLLVISHDRDLLEGMDRIVELSSLGLRSYGGGYAHYAECRTREEAAARRLLEERTIERKRQEAAIREMNERQEHRRARAKRERSTANQAKILLDGRKNASEHFSGRLKRAHDERAEELAAGVREARDRIAEGVEITVHALEVRVPPSRRILELEDVVLPFGPPPLRTLRLTLRGRERLGVVGPNGCGKSTLLRVMAGLLDPVAGTVRHRPGRVHLDQRFAGLDPGRSILEQLREVNPGEPEGVLRMKLAQLGLDALRMEVATRLLSGGERLKAALAHALYTASPAELLLLDEPSNHLDLPSTFALEAMLQGYRGALVVVSHDMTFLQRLELTHRLRATSEGWVHEGWPHAEARPSVTRDPGPEPTS